MTSKGIAVQAFCWTARPAGRCPRQPSTVPRHWRAIKAGSRSSRPHPPPTHPQTSSTSATSSWRSPICVCPRWSDRKARIDYPVGESRRKKLEQHSGDVVWALLGQPVAGPFDHHLAVRAGDDLAGAVTRRVRQGGIGGAADEQGGHV